MNTLPNQILFVDDDRVHLDFFQLILSKHGFTVKKAIDGIDALEKLKEFSPDVIILDNIMPRMSGWEMIKILKEDEKYRDIPVIMFSCLDDIKDKLAGFKLGADDYITKPFNFSEVLARIKAVLRRHASRLMFIKLERDMDDLDNTFKSLNTSDVQVLTKYQGKLREIRETIVIGKAINEGKHPKNEWKVLIVADNPINLDFSQLMLSKLGFTVEVATDGIDALEKLKSFYPDTILLDIDIIDIIIPRMSGWILIKILKEDEKYRDIPVIVLSALDDIKDKLAGFELGADDYITKPYNFSEVLARIKVVLRFHASRLMLIKLERDMDDLYNAFKSLNTSDEQVLIEISEIVDKIRETIVIGRGYTQLAHESLDKIAAHNKRSRVPQSMSALPGMKYCIVQSHSAGVFAGYIEYRKDQEVVLREARRIWYWEGAATLQQLAQSGTSLPSKCRFPEPVDRITVFGVIEILDCTEKAKESIASVPIWEA